MTRVEDQTASYSSLRVYRNSAEPEGPSPRESAGMGRRTPPTLTQETGGIRKESLSDDTPGVRGRLAHVLHLLPKYTNLVFQLIHISCVLILLCAYRFPLA